MCSRPFIDARRDLDCDSCAHEIYSEGIIVQILSKRDERGRMDDLADKLDLKQVMDRNVENLSGGELQRFAIAMCAAGKADVYMVDEPSSYLDVRQRLKAAQVWPMSAVHAGQYSPTKLWDRRLAVVV